MAKLSGDQHSEGDGKSQDAANDVVFLSPQDIKALCRLSLRRASQWRVFLLVLLVARRKGGDDAYLSIARIARRTGLAERTVKLALRDLLEQGLVTRPNRYRHLRVNLAAQERCKPVKPKPLLRVKGPAAQRRAYNCAPRSRHT
jgi:hypothetical protein